MMMILHDSLPWWDNPSRWGDPQTMKWIKRWERREDVIEQMRMQLLLHLIWSWKRCKEDYVVDALGAVDVFELMMVCCFRWLSFVSDDFETMRCRWMEMVRCCLIDSSVDGFCQGWMLTCAGSEGCMVVWMITWVGTNRDMLSVVAWYDGTDDDMQRNGSWHDGTEPCTTRNRTLHVKEPNLAC